MLEDPIARTFQALIRSDRTERRFRSVSGSRTWNSYRSIQWICTATATEFSTSAMIQRLELPRWLRMVTHRVVRLGREDDVVAAPLERLADDLLGLTAPLKVRGVNDVDPGVQGLVDDADRVVVVRGLLASTGTS